MDYKETTTTTEEINQTESESIQSEVKPENYHVDLSFTIDQINQADSLEEALARIFKMNQVFCSFCELINLKQVDFPSICFQIIPILIENGDLRWCRVLNVYTNWSFRGGPTHFIPPEFLSLIIDQCKSEIQRLEELDDNTDPIYPRVPEITDQIPTQEEMNTNYNSMNDIFAVSSILSWIANILHDQPGLLSFIVDQEIHLEFPFLMRKYCQRAPLFTSCLTILQFMLDHGYTQFSYYQNSFDAINETNKLINYEVLTFIDDALEKGNDFCFFFNDSHFFAQICSATEPRLFHIALSIAIQIIESGLDGIMQNLVDSQMVAVFIINFTYIKERTRDETPILFYRFMRKVLKHKLPYETLTFSIADSNFIELFNKDITDSKFTIKIQALKFACKFSEYLKPEDLIFCFTDRAILNIITYFDCEDSILLYYSSQLLLNVVNAGLQLPPTLNRPKPNVCDKNDSPKLNYYTIASHLDSPEFDEAISTDLTDDAPEDYINLTNELHDRVEELIEMHSSNLIPLNCDGLIDLDLDLAKQLDEEMFADLYGSNN